MKILIILISILIYSVSLIAQNLESKIPSIIHGIERPVDIESFDPIFHFPPVNQDTTYVCWSFSTLSFIETESNRLGNKPVKLSMMFPVYYGYIEKAKLFVETRGNSRFTPGDLFMTVFDVIKTHGIVPLDVYRGETRNCITFNHDALYSELDIYMNKVKEMQNWQEDKVIAGLQIILNKHLGTPPQQFNYNGKVYNPVSFAEEYVNLPWHDYMLVTTFMYDQFDSYIVLNVPDNWKKSDRFFNVTLDEFYHGIKESLLNGYSLAIDGDIGEPGRYGPLDVAIIPDYDIPFSTVSQEAREYRFEEGNTTDDHLMHLIGYQELNGVEWFLVKDSWRDAWEGNQKGYFFYREDFVKLKVLAYLVHKDGIPKIRQKLPK